MSTNDSTGIYRRATWRTGLVLAGLFCLLLARPVQAQIYTNNLYDAMRLSGTGTTGTARSLGMGGAFGTVGGDYSAGLLNPAGYGLYRRSELQMTTYLQLVNTEADYLGTKSNLNKTNFGLPSLGMVFAGGSKHGQANPNKGLLNWSVALGYNQVNNFHRNSAVTAFNPYNSVTDFLAYDAGNVEEGRWQSDYLNGNNTTYAGVGYYAYLLNTRNGTTNQYVPAVYNGNVKQTYQRQERGRLNEWNFSFAANISNRLYLGLSLGVADVMYESKTQILERDINNLYQVTNSYGPGTLPDTIAVSNLGFNDEILTRGSGVSARFGIIAAPVDFLRIGVAVQTPRLLFLNDRAQHNMTLQTDRGESYQANSNPTTFDYSVTTPYMLSGGLTGIIGDFALISAEVDFTDYRTMLYSNRGFASADFSGVNTQIANNLNVALNYRAGIEIRLSQFYLRGGFALFGSPIKLTEYTTIEDPTKTVSIDLNRYTYSGGLGYRTGGFSIDLAFVHERRNDVYNAYYVPTTYYQNTGDPNWRYRGINPPIVLARAMNNVVITLGFRFGGAE